MNPLIIQVRGGAGAGKSLLAKWIREAHAPEVVAVLEHGEIRDPRRALAEAKRDHAIVVCVGDWPEKLVKVDMEIAVRRDGSTEGAK